LANTLDGDLSNRFKAFIGIAPVIFARDITGPIIETLIALRVPEALTADWMKSFM
jgi:hypothetical protein